MPKRKLDSTSRRLQLSDVCTEISDRVANPSESEFERFVGLEHMETGETKLRKFGCTADLVSSMKLFKKGDVLVARRNVYLKRAAVADFDGVCSGDAIVLRPKDDGSFLPGIIPFVLNTERFWEYAIQHAAGTMSKRLSVKNLLQYEFALPPIEEQRRISSLLLIAEVAANAHLQLAEAAEVATTSLAIDHLHVKKLDPYRGFQNGLPRGCALTKGEDIFTPQSGNGEPGTFEHDGDCIFLKVSDLNLNDELNVATGESRYSSKKYPSLKIFGPGTIVFPKRGASIFLNKVGILRTRAALDPNLMALTLHNPEQISPEFLYWLIKAIGLHRMADVTSVPQLNHKHLSPMRFALPDAATRIEIVDRLASLRGAWKAAEARRSSLLKLKTQIVEMEVG